MNEFEKQIAEASFNADASIYRQTIKDIIKKWIENGNMIAYGFRDKENIQECLMQVLLLKTSDENVYMFIDMLNHGKFAGSQLEKAVGEYTSKVLYTMDTNESPDIFYPMVIQAIKQDKLICVARS